MTAPTTLKIALLVIGLIPFVWSSLITGTLALLRRGCDDTPDDATEKRSLAVMVSPAILGAAVLLASLFMPVSVALPLRHYVELDSATTLIAPVVTNTVYKAPVDWLSPWLWSIVAIYTGMALWSSVRLIGAQYGLYRLARQAQPATAWGEGVRVTQSAAPAFAWGRSTIVLPHSLVDALSEAQLALLIQHERAHLRRRDTLYYTILSWIEVVFWFNPFVRHQAQRGRMAAELACDAAVTQARPDMRKAYAASLLLALKHTAGDAPACAPTVFSPSNSGEFKMRLAEIMRRSGGLRKTPRYIVHVLAAVLVLPVAGAQFAWSQGAGEGAAPVAAVSPPTAPATPQHAPAKPHLTPLFTVMPLTGAVTSPYGMRLDPVTHKASFHQGIDFAAAIGTPVLAPRAGKVAAIYSNDKEGKVLEIDHGHGLKTVYLHLDSTSLTWGTPVVAGREIAKSGDTGSTVGPHLHFEVWKGRKPIDPAKVLPMP